MRSAASPRAAGSEEAGQGLRDSVEGARVDGGKRDEMPELGDVMNAG